MKKTYWIVIGVAALGLLCGTLWDVQVSQLIYTPGSPFGEFMAVAAMCPIFVLIPIAAGLLFGALLYQFDQMKNISRILGVLVEVFGVYVIYVTTKGHLGSRHLHGLPFEGLVIIQIACFLLAAALGAFASRKYPKQVLVAALIGVVAICGSRFVLDNIKNLWGRQRFWTMDNIEAQFTPWYAPQFPSAERRAEMGDLIKSFPSGHSLGAMSVLWFSLFPSFLGLCKKNEKAWTNVLTFCALGFWVLTIISRVMLGEHFLSDVSMSGILFLLVFSAMLAGSRRFSEHLYQSEFAQAEAENLDA